MAAKGLLAPAARTASRYRSYRPYDLKIIGFSQQAQQLGFRSTALACS
jgi:DNA-binding transcriptional MerR regulator